LPQPVDDVRGQFLAALQRRADRLLHLRARSVAEPEEKHEDRRRRDKHRDRHPVVIHLQTPKLFQAIAPRTGKMRPVHPLDASLLPQEVLPANETLEASAVGAVSRATAEVTVRAEARAEAEAELMLRVARKTGS